MRLSLILLLIIFITTSCSSKKRVSDEHAAVLHLNLGTSLLTDGILPQAFSELLTAKRLDPKNPTIHNNLGIAYAMRKKYSLAFKSFNQALKIKPDYTDVKNNVGRLYCDLGKYKKCIRYLTQAQNDLTYIYPEKVLSNLGYGLFLDGQLHRAKSTLKESLKIRPKHCQTFYYFSRTYYELEDYEKAAPLFDRSIKLCLESRFVEARYYSGLTYLKLGQLEMASAKFEEIINRAPLSEFANRSKNMLKLLAKAKNQ